MRTGTAVSSERSVNRWGIESDFWGSGRWWNGISLKRFDGKKRERIMVWVWARGSQVCLGTEERGEEISILSLKLWKTNHGQSWMWGRAREGPVTDGPVTTGSRRFLTGSRTHGKSLLNKQKGHFSKTSRNRSRKKRGWVEELGCLGACEALPFIGENMWLRRVIFV